MQRDDLSDDEGRGRLELRLPRKRADGTERSDHRSLVLQRAACNYCRWCASVGSARDQAGGDQREPLQTHQHDQGRHPRECVPVEMGPTVALVAGDYGKRGTVVPIGHGDAGRGGDSDRRGYAGHYLEWHTCLMQGFRLLAPASEDERVSALQSRNMQPRSCSIDQQRVDVLLPQRLVPALLAHEDAFRGRWSLGNQGGVNQPIEHYDVGCSDCLDTFDRDESGIAWTGTHEVDGTRSEIIHGGPVGSSLWSVVHP